jgi:hypothetical protein
LADDPRYRTKLWLDTYLSNANLLKDDGVAQAAFITAYADPPYPMKKVFNDPKNVDLVYSIYQPTSAPKVDWDGTTYGYREAVPIAVQTVTKQGIDGNKLLWQAEAELRRVVETYPLSSYRSLERMGPPSNVDMDGWVLFQQRYVLTYERDTT